MERGIFGNNSPFRYAELSDTADLSYLADGFTKPSSACKISFDPRTHPNAEIRGHDFLLTNNKSLWDHHEVGTQSASSQNRRPWFIGRLSTITRQHVKFRGGDRFLSNSIVLRKSRNREQVLDVSFLCAPLDRKFSCSMESIGALSGFHIYWLP
ncbi:hypothetical protein RB195_020120 [Necator americanus]|uniref:Uncharacterized protein n=1 Tax=Necator americanus TaxID=51031 RepID=A0ABR1CHC0_NECAM